MKPSQFTIGTFPIYTGLLTLVLFSDGRADERTDYPRNLLNIGPTIAQLRNEVQRADIVIRARVKTIHRHKKGNHADQDVLVDILRCYKGQFPDPSPSIRLETYWHRIWDEQGAPPLPQVGTELILLIDVVRPRHGNPPPLGQSMHYMVPFYYLVTEDNMVESLFGFPMEMLPHLRLDRMEDLILNAITEGPPVPPKFQTAEVLLTDNFDDHSLAGWTFLEGNKIRKPFNTDGFIWQDAVNYIWIGPHNIHLPQLELFVSRDLQGGFYKGTWNHVTPVEFGIVNGRLRLRTQHVLQHITAVTGDPEWTDYQIDVDMYTFNNPASPHGPTNYLKFGPYGRVHIPNFPETSGEHSMVAVEIGNYANYDVSEGTWGNAAFQIRCKFPEPSYIVRDPSRIVRLTDILDYTPWTVKEKIKIHLCAKFFGDHVEGWINGEKVLEGTIPSNHPGIQRGRIALWTFETWSEFDNLVVRRLIPQKTH